jgi:hypothetical protein
VSTTSTNQSCERILSACSQRWDRTPRLEPEVRRRLERQGLIGRQPPPPPKKEYAPRKAKR